MNQSPLMRIIFEEDFGEVHTNTLARHHVDNELTFIMLVAMMTIGRQLALYEVPVQISINAVLAALHQLLFVNIACMPTGNLVLITGLAEETVP